MQIPRLREQRELRGWTQKDLARESGVSARSIAGYEAGSGARPPTVRKLSEALGVEISDLVGEREAPKAPAPPSQQLTLNGLLAEERRNFATVREIKHLKGHVQEQLKRWRKAAAGEDFYFEIDYLYASEVWLQVSSLTEWLRKMAHIAEDELSPEAADDERMEIVRLIDGMQDVAAEIQRTADEAADITFDEAADESGAELSEAEQALIAATAAAIMAEENPDDEVAARRRRQAEARYEALLAAKTAQQQAADVKRDVAGE